MKFHYQSDEDIELEIPQIQHKLAALEIAIKRKNLRLSELRTERGHKGRVSTGQEDRNRNELYIGDKVKVLTTSKNRSFVVGKTEAKVTGVTPTKQVTISDLNDNKNKTWRESCNLELVFDNE